MTTKAPAQARPKQKKPRIRAKPLPVIPSGEYLTKRQVCEKFAITFRTLEQWVDKERFPAPYRFTGQTLRWRATEIEKFIEGSKGQPA